MKKFTILLGFLAWCLVGAAAGAALATTTDVYCVSPGWVEHNWFPGPPPYDEWNAGGTAAYSSNGSYQDVSLQFSLAGLDGKMIQSARLYFEYACDPNPSGSTTIACGTLNHYGGSTAPTGNAANDKLFGSDYLATCYYPVGGGWTQTSVDVTALVQADLHKGHQWAVFSLNHTNNPGCSTTAAVGSGPMFSYLRINFVPLALTWVDLMLLTD